MLDETVFHIDSAIPVTGSGEVAPQPTRRPDKKLLDSYSEWLFHERRLLCMEMYPDAKNPEEFVPVNTGARAFHFSGNWAAEPQPSTRAAHVLDAVGCDWINRGRRQPTTRDPVFDLIAAERATYCALQRVWDEWDAVEGEPLPDKKRREAEASRVSADARDAVYAAQPTTSAGLLAMLQLFYERNIDEIDSDTQAMFARVRTFLSRQTASTAVRDPVFDLLDHEAELLRRSDAALSHDWDGEGQVAADRQREAEAVLMSTAPMTVAGFAAVVERWIERENCVAPGDGAAYDNIMSLIKAGKATAEFAAPKPDPIEVLWRQRQDACRKYEVEPVTPNDDDDHSPVSRLLNQIWDADAAIQDAAPSLTQAAASALIQLTHGMPMAVDKIADVDRQDITLDWVAVNTLKALRPYLTGLLAETVADVLDHPDRPLWDGELCPRRRPEPEQSSTLLAAE